MATLTCPADFRVGDTIGTIVEGGTFKPQTIILSLDPYPSSSCNGVHVNDGVKGSHSQCYDRAARFWVRHASA